MLTREDVEKQPWIGEQRAQVLELVESNAHLAARNRELVQVVSGLEATVYGRRGELTFTRFREVNVERAKTFPSAKQGWGPADWVVALMGEVGELAACLPEDVSRVVAIDASRVVAIDAEMAKRVVAALGAVCNTMKKLRRGADYTKGKNKQELRADLEQQIVGLQFWASRLCDVLDLPHWTMKDGVSVQASAVLDAGGDPAAELGDVQTYLDLLANNLGVKLDEATVKKFNEVSKRVGSELTLP